MLLRLTANERSVHDVEAFLAKQEFQRISRAKRRSRTIGHARWTTPIKRAISKPFRSQLNECISVMTPH
eukprot:6196306-Pleurochrysis_carterae.AAC.3